MQNNKEDARRAIEEVPDSQYDEYAWMVMRSLRGSWNSPQVRVHILDHLCENEDVFDEETREQIQFKIEIFKRDYFDGWHDGRLFRPIYQGLDVDIGQDVARELSEYIPDDRTWDEYQIERLD